MDNSVFYQRDYKSICSYNKHQEKQIKLKRRWLLGLSTSKSEHIQSSEPEFLRKRSMPETLLREDDIFYEIIKSNVEECFRVYEAENETQLVEKSKLLFDTTNTTSALVFCLDALKNKGLYNIATIVTGGSSKFEGTRRKMKQVIRESLSEDSGNKEIDQKIHQAFKDPKSLRENCGMTSTFKKFKSHHIAAAKILDELKILSFETLVAMQKKLRRVRDVPQLPPRRCGSTRHHVEKKVKKISHKMLSELGEEDKLPEPLAKAMAIAVLSLQLRPGYQDLYPMDFYTFSAEVRGLQNEIVKAMLLLNSKVRNSELKTLQLLLDPEAIIPDISFRSALKKMLTEYLFKCDDMETIPKPLLEALTFINRNSRSAPHLWFSKEEVEEEVECILCVSAQTRQIVWDLLPEREFDEDFADAYMEELKESDDGGDNFDDNEDWQMEDRNSKLKVSPSSEEVESSAEWIPVDPSPMTPKRKLTWDCNERAEVQNLTIVNSGPPSVIPFSLSQESGFLGTLSTNINQLKVKIERDKDEEDSKFDLKEPLNSYSNFFIGSDKSSPIKQITCRNQFLAAQEVCDKTSMAAYKLIGSLVKRFAEVEDIKLHEKDLTYLGSGLVYGDSPDSVEPKRTLFGEDSSRPSHVLEELLPYLPKSRMDKLKELMGTIFTDQMDI